MIQRATIGLALNGILIPSELLGQIYGYFPFPSVDLLSFTARIAYRPRGMIYGEDIMGILPTRPGKSVILQLFTLVKMYEGQLTSN